MKTPANRTVLRALLLTLFAVVAIGVNSIVYANHVARQSERNWCDVVTTLDNAYRERPPASPVGRKLAVDMHQLRIRLGCP